MQGFRTPTPRQWSVDLGARFSPGTCYRRGISCIPGLLLIKPLAWGGRELGTAAKAYQPGIRDAPVAPYVVKAGPFL